jgi:superfamily II DNA helicase RecQ
VKNIIEDIIMFIREKYLYQSGIIYCLSRYECEDLCAQLSDYEVKCDFYHARMSDAARKDV